LIVDEANQLVDPELLIPIVLDPTSVTLYGDSKQIGASCHSRQSQLCGYTVSLLERVCTFAERNAALNQSILLAKQYRMHPALAEFSSRQFYDGQVKSGVTAEEMTKSLSHITFPDPDIPLLFLDCPTFCEYQSESGTSYWNSKETIALAEILDRLHQSGVDVKQIGVITFYDGEVDFAKEAILALCNSPEPFTSQIEVHSVDAYEGRDVDYVVLVCVRANPQGEIGFLQDAGRMNVALTRARYGLFVVGNVLTLESGSNWRDFCQYCREKGLIINSLT
jgi:regulator of nonsense transcripts 1